MNGLETDDMTNQKEDAVSASSSVSGGAANESRLAGLAGVDPSLDAGAQSNHSGAEHQQTGRLGNWSPLDGDAVTADVFLRAFVTQIIRSDDEEAAGVHLAEV